jgi:hypothetical protein
MEHVLSDTASKYLHARLHSIFATTLRHQVQLAPFLRKEYGGYGIGVTVPRSLRK